MAEIYTVHTDLNPEQLTEVTKETYRLWLQFAAGRGQIGGRTLAHPSGQYAQSISWKQTGQSSVAIIADESIAPVAATLETGTTGADIKAAMLGRGNTKTSADGYQYRVIPLKGNNGPFDFNNSQISTSNRGESITKGAGQLWATQSSDAGDGTRYRVMSDRPGSAAWQVPPMAPYAPAKLLSELIARASTLV